MMDKFEWHYCCNTRCSLRVVCARDFERKVGDSGVIKFYHPVKGLDGAASCAEFVKSEKRR